VVEALARIVRPVVEDAVEWFARNDLAPSRPDRICELGDEAVAVTVGRDEDAFRFERLDVFDPVVLADLGSRGGGASSEAARETRRLDRAAPRLRDRSVEASGRSAGHVFEPFGGEAVLSQGLVLEPDGVPFFLLGREPIA